MTISFWSDRTAPRLRVFDERIVELWNRAHPDAHVELTTIDHERFRDEMETYLTSPRPPDVLTWFAGNRLRSFTERGLMLNLADVWAAEGFARSYTTAFQQLAQVGDGVYFLPTSYYWWAIYYRPSVFRAVGVAAPIKTWDDLLAACEAFRRAGRRPFALGARYRCPAAAWFDYLNMRINGPGFHQDLMRLKASYLDERVRDVFRYWSLLLDHDAFAGDPASYDEAEAVDLVLRGEAGMVLIGAYITDEFVPDGDDDLDFFRFPVIAPSISLGEDAPVDGYFIAGRTANPEESRAFLAYLGSREVQHAAVNELSALPTRIDVDCDGASKTARQGMELIRGADQVSQFYDLDTPWELADAGMETFVSFLRNPATIDASLYSLEDIRVQLLRQASGC